MKKILITAFDAFGDDNSNASFELLQSLPTVIAGHEILKLQVPTVRYRCFKTIETFLAQNEVDIIISLGQAAQTETIRFEKVAINLDDFRIKDNDGNQPSDESVVVGAPLAYFTKLPIKFLNSKLQENKIPSFISYSAGTFVCNHLMYSLLHFRKELAGFIHVPQIKSENTIGLELSTLVHALTLVIEHIDNPEIHTVAGEIS